MCELCLYVHTVTYFILSNLILKIESKRLLHIKSHFRFRPVLYFRLRISLPLADSADFFLMPFPVGLLAIVRKPHVRSPQHEAELLWSLPLCRSVPLYSPFVYTRSVGFIAKRYINPALRLLPLFALTRATKPMDVPFLIRNKKNIQYFLYASK